MEKMIQVAVYGFTAHQSVLLSPFIRKLWNVGKIRHISSEALLRSTMENADMLVVNGCLDFYDLEYALSLTEQQPALQVACIVFDKLTCAGYEAIQRHDIPVVIAGLKDENDISICEMGIAASTVGTYFSRIYKKCGAASRNDLYRKLSF